MELLINFHNLIGVSVQTDSHAAYDFFSAEYSYHIADHLPEECLRVILHFKEGICTSPPPGFTFHQHKYLARWSYRLVITEKIIEIDVIGNRMSIPMIHHMLVHSAVRVLASFQGVIMLHAGAVVKDGRSFIFTGRGGAGKTTTTSLLLATGIEWSLHADDYVFLSSDLSSSMAYLTRAHLYRPLLAWVPDVRLRLTLLEKLQLVIFSMLRSWSNDFLKWPTRISLKQLWPDNKLVMKSIPAGLLFMEHRNIRVPEIHILSPSNYLVDKLISMNFYEARHFIQLLRKSNSLAELDKWLANWQEREQTILNNFIRSNPIFQLYLPERIKSLQDIRRDLPELINSIFG